MSQAQRHPGWRAPALAWTMAALVACGGGSSELPKGGEVSSRRQALSAVPTAQSGASAADASHNQIDDGCNCELRFADGQAVPVAQCDQSRCLSMIELRDCEEDPDADCNPVASCTCDCQAFYHIAEVEKEEDTLLAGVMNLWQFDYGCKYANPAVGLLGVGALTLAELLAKPDNYVGCAVIAATELIYWWAQQGYDSLVEDHLEGPGIGPSDRLHDWMALGQQFYDDYLYTLCVPFGRQTAATQDSLANGLRGYIQDAGYNVSVGHYKVCDDCSANGDDKLRPDEGLAVIKSELRAGRPVIMGFNVGRAMDSRTQIIDENLNTLSLYNGALSNGTPGFGIISHYAVVTGYRRFGAHDVLIVNLGWGNGTEEEAFLWAPAGKWLHLYTVDIKSLPEGAAWCSIDRGAGNVFLDADNINYSGGQSAIEQAVAGTFCGIDRDEEIYEESGVREYTTGYYCDMHTMVQTLERSDDIRVTMLESGAAVILDRQEELPDNGEMGR